MELQVPWNCMRLHRAMISEPQMTVADPMVSAPLRVEDESAATFGKAIDALPRIPAEAIGFLTKKKNTTPAETQLVLPLPSQMVTFRYHQYQVVGRALPTENDEHPKIYRMKLWATNEVRAKSKFWYFLRKLKKVKKSNGQVLAINEIFEKNPTKIKNYGIWLRYQSRTGYHNMYKEYRDTTLNGAVEQMYNEMASRHRVRSPCIQIIKTATIPAKLCKRESTKQFHDSKIKFPLVFKKVRPPTRKLKTTYKASRPNLFM
ncbi:Ribosomal protein 50S-L18Ae/60S-L20/60S-L18A [Sesbania bispinosa]|nr:Ribosomal protein 50S-L18Ae/60S-L20/60S-L18A [Sesbania bispinosa]